jgi:hypothetical protein
MDESTRTAWLTHAIDEVFVAFAESSSLAGRLIYKGARILDRRLNRAERASLDIDANLTAAFVAQFPSREAQRDELQREIARCVDRRLRRSDPMQYELESVRVDLQPPRAHPLGFDALSVRIRLADLRLVGVLGLPTITIDIAAPENLRPTSVSPLAVGDRTVLAYALPRIAAEKLRAFIQSLPEYCSKLRRPGGAVRAKDLCDLARILDDKPITDTAFWNLVGEEFVTACQSRHVDCAGPEAFEQQLPVTQRTYESDRTLPSDRPWPVALHALRAITSDLHRAGFLGFTHPLPHG